VRSGASASGHAGGQKLWLTPAIAGVALAALLGLFALYQLIPRPGGQFPEEIMMIFVPRRLFGPIRALFPEGIPVALAPLAALGWAAALASLLRHLRALAFLLATTTTLTYIFVFKHVGGDRHYGLLLIVLVMALWLAENDRRLAPGWPRRSWPGEELDRRLARAAVTLVTLCLGVSAVFAAARIWPREIREDFSEAQRMGRFIRDAGLDARTIVAHPASQAEAVLPHLARSTFYYPSLGASGSHMWWDARYQQGTLMSVSEAVDHARNALPAFRDGNALLLLNGQLPDAKERGLSLMYRTAGKPWRVPDESFFLYQRARP
jgi:hypothetical protein